jgi:porin
MSKQVGTALIVGTLLAATCLVHDCSAQTENEVGEEETYGYALGDLGREALAEKGYTLEIFAMNDTWGNTTGGVYRRASTLGNLYTMAEVDTEKAGWWDSGRLHFEGVYIYGGRPVRAVGDFQYTSSIDSFETYDVWEGYYEHSLRDERFKVLVGIKDLTREFAVLQFAYRGINSSFTTPATITQYGYSFYPTTGLGIQTTTKTSEDTYILAAVYDGRPSDPITWRSRDYGLSARDGAYFISEIGYQDSEMTDSYGKLALGAWHNTGHFTDINGYERTGNTGVYLIGERMLLAESEGSSQGLGIFGQAGQAAQDRNANSWYFGGGLHYQGPIPGRDDDELMLGLNMATFSRKYKETYPGTEYAERVVELSYRLALTPYLTLTPDVQYINNPGGDPTRTDAVIVYLRSEVLL